MKSSEAALSGTFPRRRRVHGRIRRRFRHGNEEKWLDFHRRQCEMFPNSETCKNIRAGIISVARELTDSDYQEEVWVQAARPNVMASFYEAVGALLDDYSAPEVIVHAAELGFDEKQAHRLKTLVDELSRFNDAYGSRSDAEIIKMPEWRVVMASARAFLESL